MNDPQRPLRFYLLDSDSGATKDSSRKLLFGVEALSGELRAQEVLDYETAAVREWRLVIRAVESDPNGLGGWTSQATVRK